MNNDNEDFGFLGGRHSIEALRSVGYRNTAMAIGELIDNSIQAHAKNVTIVLSIYTTLKGSRRTTNIKKIAIIDDGIGMSSTQLRNSLRLGTGTHHDDSEGMGKFGVGLPQASISQAKRVDAWSWQSGINSVKRAFIDLNDEEWISHAQIESPDEFPIPEEYKQFITNSESGTVIEWSILDRTGWKKPKTVYSHTELEIGRMYRYWLNTDIVKIRLVSIDESGKIEDDNNFRPMDPLFLMEDGICGENVPAKPLFKHYVENEKKTYTLEKNGESIEVSVTLKFSIAKESVWPGDKNIIPGNQDYGKLAAKNQGVSVVREGRELELLDYWYVTESNDPRHRWWGVEINFSRDFDDVFGVTSNKQSATRINEFAKKPISKLYEEYGIDSRGGLSKFDKIKEEDYYTYILIDLVEFINDKIGLMFDVIKKARKENTNKARRFTRTESVDIYTTGIEEQIRQGIETESDDFQIGITPKMQADNIKADLANSEFTPENIEDIIYNILEGKKISIVPTPLSTSAFFEVRRYGPVVIVALNDNHEMYSNLFGKYEEYVVKESKSKEDLETISRFMYTYLSLMLLGWARMEDKAQSPMDRQNFQRVREDWGRTLSDLINSHEDSKHR